MGKRLWTLLLVIALLVGSGTIAGHTESTGRAASAETQELWVSHGPRGGRALALEVSPAFADDGVAFSGEWLTSYQSTESGMGIVRSTDGGQTWAISDAGTQGVSYASAIHDYAFSPDFNGDQTVFAATWGGLFRSTNGGENWSWLEDAYSGPPGAYTTIAVAPDFGASQQVLAGDWGGMLRSDDGGVSWQRLDETGAAADIAFSPSYATDGIVVSSDGSKVYRSEDAALTWTPVLTAPVTSLVASPAFALDETFLGSGGANLYMSDDGGSTWMTRTVAADVTMLHDLAVSPDFTSDHTLFAGASNGLYWSQDGGHTWEEIPAYAGTAIRSLAISPQWPQHAVLLVGTDAGVDRLLSSGPGAGVVRQPAAGFAPLVSSPLDWSQGANLLLTATSNHGIYGSRDGGNSWQAMGLQASSSYYGFSDVAISPDFEQDDTIFAAWLSGTGIGGAVYRSQDSGVEWENVYSTDYVGDLAISPAFASNRTVFVTSGDHGLVRSSNGGDHWEEVGSWPGGGSHGIAQYIALPPDYPTDATLFVGGSQGVWRLPQGETTWQPALTGITSQHTVIAIATSPDYANDGALLAIAYHITPGGQEFDVYRSQDRGLNWQESDMGIPAAELFDVSFSQTFAQDQIAYVSAASGDLYRSQDGGQTWTLFGTAPGTPALYDVIVTGDGRVYVGSQQGVWQVIADPLRTYLPLLFGSPAPG